MTASRGLSSAEPWQPECRGRATSKSQMLHTASLSKDPNKSTTCCSNILLKPRRHQRKEEYDRCLLYCGDHARPGKSWLRRSGQHPRSPVVLRRRCFAGQGISQSLRPRADGGKGAGDGPKCIHSSLRGARTPARCSGRNLEPTVH